MFIVVSPWRSRLAHHILCFSSYSQGWRIAIRPLIPVCSQKWAAWFSLFFCLWTTWHYPLLRELHPPQEIWLRPTPDLYLWIWPLGMNLAVQVTSTLLNMRAIAVGPCIPLIHNIALWVTTLWEFIYSFQPFWKWQTTSFCHGSLRAQFGASPFLGLILIRIWAGRKWNGYLWTLPFRQKESGELGNYIFWCLLGFWEVMILW